MGGAPINGAGKDYYFKDKNKWRSWEWNQIRRHCRMSGIDPSTALIVGLFGGDGLDIAWAKRKGFRRTNMIGVEKDSAAAARLRKALGITVIEGNLYDVLECWGGRDPIGVLLADFCGGFSKEFEDRFLHALWSSSALSSSTVVALNLLRGRDSSPLAAAQFPKLQWFDRRLRSYVKARSRARLDPQLNALDQALFRVGPNHRAFHALFWMVVRCESDWRQYDSGFRKMAPALQSYRSGRLFYDSAVFCVSLERDDARARLIELEANIDALISRFAEVPRAMLDAKEKRELRELSRRKAMRRKIAAARAVRTKRERGEVTGEGCPPNPSPGG